MSNAVAYPKPETKVLEYPFSDEVLNERDTEPIRGWKHGCGTPYPDTPLSQRYYDGENPFEDSEPWF